MSNLTLSTLTDNEILAAISDLAIEVDPTAYSNAADEWLVKLPLIKVKPLNYGKVAA